MLWIKYTKKFLVRGRVRMTKDKKLNEVIDIISEMIIKYIEDSRELNNKEQIKNI